MHCVMMCLIAVSAMLCMSTVSSSPYWPTAQDNEDFNDMTDTGVPTKDMLGEDMGDIMFSRMRKQFPQVAIAYDTYSHRLQSSNPSTVQKSSGSSTNPRFNRGNKYRLVQA